MLRARWAALAFAVLLFGLSANPARAQIFYGITNGNQLITIDPTTGAGTLVGPLSSNMQSTGLGFRGNTLYAWDTVTNQLQQLDPATAATVATINIGVVAGGGGDLTFRSDGMGFLSAAIPVSGLWRFDVTVPSSTLITSPLTPNMYGLAFSPAGVLYGLKQNGAELHTIDQTTGVTTLVGFTGLPVLLNGGLAFDTSGTLFAVFGPGVGPSSLYKINTVTAAPTLIGSTGFNAVAGITFKPGPPPPFNGGVGEGTYQGSNGPFGPEGGYGFGGQPSLSEIRLPAPRNDRMRGMAALVGPFVEGPTGQQKIIQHPAWPGATMTVLNQSHRQNAALSAENGSVAVGLGPWGWTILSGVALLGIAGLLKLATLRARNSQASFGAA